MPDDKPLRGLIFQKSEDLWCDHVTGDKTEKLMQNVYNVMQYTFQNPNLILEALTHSTYAYEHRQDRLPDNERLEFLGDAVLDLAISDMLFREPDQYAEGYMTKIRALVVRETTLAALAGQMNLGQCLFLGKGEEATGGREKPSNLANAVEALFGALFLDAGYEKTGEIIRRLLDEPLKLALAGDLVYDYKSRLIENVQATRGNSTLEFIILKETGPVHERVFTAGVIVDGQLIASGNGSSKKEAEQNASRDALEKLDCSREGCTRRTSD